MDQDDWQPVGQAASTPQHADDWQPVGGGNQSQDVAADVSAGLQTGAIKGGANLAATLAANTNPVTGAIYDVGMAAKYGLPALNKYSNYLASDVAAPIRKLMGKPDLTPEQEDQISSEGPLATVAKYAGMIPSAGEAVSAGANAIGHPLAQPQTPYGRVAEGTLENAGLAGAGALGALPAAAAMTTAPEVVRGLGGGQQAQDWSSLAGGLGVAKAAAKGLPEANDGGGPSDVPPDNTPLQTSADIKDHYKEVRQATQDLDGALSPDAAKDMLNMMKGPEPTNAVERVAAGNNKLRAYAQNLEDEGFGDEPLTIQAYEKLHKDLGDAAWGERDAQGKISPQGLEFQKAQQYLKMLPDKATPENGYIQDNNTDGFNAYKYGTQLYAQQAKLAQIEKIVHDSSILDGAEKARYQQQQFRNLFRNGKKSAGFTDDEMDTVTNAAQKGITDKALGMVSDRFLFPAAALTGHFDAGLGLAGAKYGLSALAAKIQQNRTNAVMDAVRNRNLGDHPDYVAMAAAKNAAANAPKLALPSPSINVPAEGFGQQPSPVSTPDINYNPSQRALPAPREFTNEQIADRWGLPSPSSVPVSAPAGGFKATYSPNDLNVSGDVSVPETKMDSNPQKASYLNVPEPLKPVAASKQLPPAKQEKPYSFFDVLRKAGGIQRTSVGGENLANVMNVGDAPRGLIKQNGLTHEQALKLAVREGFINDKGDNPNGTTQNELKELYDLMDRGKDPHPNFAGQSSTKAYRNNLEMEADRRDIKHAGVSDNDLVQELNNHKNAEEKEMEEFYANEAAKAGGSQTKAGGGVQKNEQFPSRAASAGSGQKNVGSVASGNDNPSAEPDEAEIPFAKGGLVGITHPEWVKFIKEYGKKYGYVLKDKNDPACVLMAIKVMKGGK